jgi:hypothetical protein
MVLGKHLIMSMEEERESKVKLFSLKTWDSLAMPSKARIFLCLDSL